MLEVFDLDLRKQAILQNAFDVKEGLVINNISHLTFSLPHNDEKVKYCKPFHYVRLGDNLYRILPNEYTFDVLPVITFECEHVIATLIDDIMYGDIVIGNIGVYTDEVIRFVLSKQTKGNWQLGVCEFARQFEYGWSSESLLSALFSIPTNFVDPYIWEFDTSSYPWTVSLKKLNTDAVPSLYVHKGKNMLSLKRRTDPTNICTRLYAHGYGEGINALTFADINGGKPYIESPPEYIDKYGLKTRLWVDRRYENKESLLQAARAMLNELQEPGYEYEVQFVEVDKTFYNKAELGKVVKLVTDGVEHKTYIIGVAWDYQVDRVDCTLTIANKPKDVAASVADLADRQRIEMTYAQGATQLYAQSIQANCDSSSGAVLSFHIPAEMKIVNAVKAKIKIEQFRAYSKSTSVQEQSVQTSSSGGGSTQTSSSGGGSTQTSSGGGGVTTDTGPSGINVKYDMFDTTEAEGHKHQTRQVIAHQHEIELEDHTHSVTTPAHTHSTRIPSHTHSTTIPQHDHDITPGIYRFGNPNSFSIWVNGNMKATIADAGTEIDLTQYLVSGQDGKIPRGSWHTIEVRPNDLAYVSIDMFVQGFVQSRGDATV